MYVFKFSARDNNVFFANSNKFHSEWISGIHNLQIRDAFLNHAE